MAPAFRSTYLVLAALLHLLIAAGASESALADTPTPAAASAPAGATAGSTTPVELSLDDLLNLKVSVATKRETSLREQPGIVTVLTADQIRDIGARDLRDVLNVLVPGFSLVSDVEIGTTVAVRGLQTSEGKLLLMINGLPMNENKYGTLQYHDHFPVDYIDRIEIIRGPGSAIYGGYAALAVINILTKNAAMNGGYVSLMQDTATPGGLLGQRIATGTGGHRGDLSWYLNAVEDRGTLSLRSFDSFAGDPVNMADGRGAIRTTHADAGITYKQTTLKLLAERFQTPYFYFSEPDVLNWHQYHEQHDTYTVQLTHDFKVTPTLTITPQATYEYQRAFYIDQGPYWSRNPVERRTGGLAASWDVTPKTNVLFGVEDYLNVMLEPHNPSPFDGPAPPPGNSGHISYHNTAAYVQMMNFNDIVNLTLGLRYDKTDIFGDNYAPRLGLTKVVGAFHAKYMLSESFKVPGGAIYGLEAPGTTLKPEKAVNNEVELGYQFTKHVWLVTNIFDTVLRDLQVFQADPNGGYGTYANGGKIGTRGFDAEVKLVFDKADAGVSYSEYHLTVNEELEYQVPGHKDAALAAPNQRFGFHGGVKFTPDTSAHISGYYRGKRYAFVSQGQQTGTDSNGDPIYGQHELRAYNPDAIVNLILRLRNAFGARNLEVDLVAQNLTNQEQEMGQFVNNDASQAPLPGLPRSVTVSATQTW